MTPYVDFTDSKGPLLWLIYGIGYLISNFTYIGIYWISTLTYGITLFLCYKTAFLLTEDKKRSLLAALAMILPYFLHWCHYEIRSEDFCHPFVICGLYYLLKNTIHPNKKTLQLGGFILGICFVACLLIKWSIAFMYLSFLFSLGYVALKQREIKEYFIFLLIGIGTLSIPFLIYFIQADNFAEFLNEYFINTIKTVSSTTTNSLFAYVAEWCFALSSYKLIYLFYAGSIYLLYQRNKAITILPLICCLFFLCSSLRHDLLYYTTIIASFAIFGIIIILENLNKVTSILFILVITSFQTRHIFKEHNLFYDQKNRKEFYEAAYIMSQINHPKIVNEVNETGIGISAHTLPGSKYWSRQYGETQEMKKERHDAIRKGIPDFITCQFHFESNKNSEFDKLLSKSGYIYYCKVPFQGDQIYIYGKPGLQLPDKSFSISNTDILLKRKLF